MFTTNIRGIENVLKNKNALISISTNRRFVYVLKSVSDDGAKVYIGHSFKNMLIKASKFLPEGKNETQNCIASNGTITNSIEFALKDAGFMMRIYVKDEQYIIEMYLKSDKEKLNPWIVKQCKTKQGLLTAINELEADLDKKLFDYKLSHPKDFGIED